MIHAKHSKCLGMHGRNVLAGLLLLSIVSGGCVIPQDEQVIPPLPPKRNGPLKIVSHNPPDLRITYYNCAFETEKNPKFSVSVKEEDQKDRVYSNWFIDKSDDASPLPTSATLPGPEIIKTVNAPSFGNRLANLQRDTHHLLTVYVADSPFDEVVKGKVSVSREPLLLPDGGTLVDDGSIDTITWVLDIESCP